VVFVAVFVGEENPQSVDAEGSTERRMEESKDAEDDGGDASPRATLHESEAHADAAGGKDEQGAADEVEDQREELGKRLTLVDDKVHGATEDEQNRRRDEKERAHDHPEDAEGVQMSLEAGLGDGADWVAEAAAALWAGLGIRLKFGSAAVAEHERVSVNRIREGARKVPEIRLQGSQFKISRNRRRLPTGIMSTFGTLDIENFGTC
jgi:hypothetical protein